jgi:hypothetical protein
MEVPRLLQEPWSPVGYQVVEVANETNPVPPASQRTGPPEPARLPWSAAGYRVVQVSEEKTPGLPRFSPKAYALVRALKGPPPRRTHPLAVWGPVAGGLFVLVCVTTLAMASLSTPAHGGPRHQVAFVDAPVREVNIPAAVPVIPLAEAGEAAAPGEGAAALPPGGIVRWPGVREVNLPRVNAPQGVEDPPQAAGCLVPGEGQADPAVGQVRETFGTAVTFARSPLVAAEAARKEHKLTFLLHVSGNFEEARFT